MWVSVERYLFNKVYNKLKSNLIIQNNWTVGFLIAFRKTLFTHISLWVKQTSLTKKRPLSMVEDVGITLHVYSQARNRDEASQIIQF